MLTKKLSQSFRRSWRRVVTVLAATVVAAGLGAAATAAFSTHSATRFTQLLVRTSDSAWNLTTASPAGWNDVPGSALSFTVPSGQTRMVDTTFSAESHCANTSWCSARVVIVTPAGSTIELRPASGTDFAFDSPNDLWESQSMNRTSFYWAPGTYVVKVQAALIGPAAGASFRLDDWNFGVRVYAAS